MRNSNWNASNRSLITALNFLVIEIFLASALVVFMVENIGMHHFSLGLAEALICSVNVYDAQRNYNTIKKHLKGEL